MQPRKGKVLLMKITTIIGGPVPTNCYLFKDESTGLAAVVDPGFESEELTQAVLQAGTENIKYILLTHGHFDHIMGVAKMKELTGAKICMYKEEVRFAYDASLNLSAMFYGKAMPPFSIDMPLSENDSIELGGLSIRVLHTPGHTSGGCCFIVGNVIFSGDTLMKLSCGRTDFPTGSYDQILDSLQKLKHLEGDFEVYPGHGSKTRLEYERQNNTYMESRSHDSAY